MLGDDQAIRPVVLLGPTAGGKSELAVAVAETLGGQVISADSMQVYRRMDAGTAKPTTEMRHRVHHHMVDVIEPTERFTVADWLRMADAVITDLRGRGVRPVIVGGTNLYLRALLLGMFQSPGHDPVRRRELGEHDPAELYRRLAIADPEAAERIHPNDQKKLVRAVEVIEATGRPISELQVEWDDDERRAYRYDPILIGLSWPTEAINRRINHRVKAMFNSSGEDGSSADTESLPDETRRLEAEGVLGPQARRALGYRQVLDHLAGRCSLDDAFEKTKIQTRRFAKNQRTWLKRFRGVCWLAADQLTQVDQLEAAVRAITTPGANSLDGL